MMALTNIVFLAEFRSRDPFSIKFLVLILRLGLISSFSLCWCVSIALPLIETGMIGLVIIMIIIMFVVRGIGLGLFTEMEELLLHLVASNAVGVKGLVEVRDDETFEVEVRTAPPVLDTLNCRRDSAQNTEFVSSKEKFFALKVGEL